MDTNLTRDERAQLNHNMTMAVLPVTIFIGIECVVGLFGNILILLIYSRHYGKSTFRCLVLSMAIIDLTSCLTTLPGEIFSQMNWYHYRYAWICKVKSFFNVLTAFASAEILFVLAFDRFRKVCRPLAWQIQPSTTVRLCIGAVVLAAMAASPALVLWGRQDYVYIDGNLKVNVSICEKSTQFADQIYPFLYVTFVYTLPVGVMMLTICILNILTTKTSFCGINDWNKGSVRKSVSVSTIASTLSVSQDMSIDAQEEKVNIRSTGIDIWVGTITQNDSLRTFDTGSSVRTERAAKRSPGSRGGLSNTKKVGKMKEYVVSKTEYQESGHGIYVQKEPNVHVTKDTLHSETEKISNVSKESVKTNFSLSDGSRSTFQSHGSPRCPEIKISSETAEHRRKRKTVIMLVLTSVFIVTVLMYIVMTSIVADSDGALRVLSNSGKTAFFFFWRMYFINCVVNPILYGFVDPRFRSGLRTLFSGKRSLNCC